MPISCFGFSKIKLVEFWTDIFVFLSSHIRINKNSPSNGYFLATHVKLVGEKHETCFEFGVGHELERSLL